MAKKSGKKTTQKPQKAEVAVSEIADEGGVNSENETEKVTVTDNVAKDEDSNSQEESKSDETLGPTTEHIQANEQPEKPAHTATEEVDRSESERESPSPQLTPARSTPKKRLTLQERLALAAKGKKAKAGTSSPNLNADESRITSDQSKEGTPEPPNSTHTSQTTHQSEGNALSPQPSTKSHTKIPSVTINDGGDTPKSQDDTSAAEISNLKELLSKSKLENTKLTQEIETLKSRQSLGNDSKDLLNKLASKEDTIQQLLSEGEALSKKELKLNETIKKLRTTNSDLESTLTSFSEKDEAIQVKLVEIENALKVNKVNSVEELISSMHSLSIKCKELQAETEKNKEWESKYKDQLKLYEQELETRKESQRDYNELKIQFNISKKQNLLEIETKNTLINNLKKEISHLKEDNLDEITRLEGKIEHLRAENENHAHSNGRSINSDDYGKTNDDSGDAAIPKKQVDYKEFASLSENHFNLQQQYLSSQENWKVIEANFLKKVESLNSAIESTKAMKNKSQADLKKLQTQLNKKTEELRELQESFNTLKSEHGELVFQNEFKDSNYSELQERFETFKQIYNNDRNTLNLRVSKLNEQLEEAQQKLTIQQRQTSISSESQTSLKRYGAVSGMNASFDYNLANYPRNLHRDSSVNESVLSEVKFGESCTTPAMSRDTSSIFLHQNNSSNSFATENGLDGMETGEDAISYNERTSTIGGLTQNNNSSGITNNLSNENNVSSGNNNIQLITKMSSNIRRLEIELNTLRNENSRLSDEKEQIQGQIIEKIRLEEDFAALKKKFEEREKLLEENKEKEQTMLDIIGEKSDQVEELKADVADLKDLCKLQVQQMIAMKEDQ